MVSSRPITLVIWDVGFLVFNVGVADPHCRGAHVVHPARRPVSRDGDEILLAVSSVDMIRADVRSQRERHRAQVWDVAQSRRHLVMHDRQARDPETQWALRNCVGVPLRCVMGQGVASRP